MITSLLKSDQHSVMVSTRHQCNASSASSSTSNSEPLSTIPSTSAIISTDKTLVLRNRSCNIQIQQNNAKRNEQSVPNLFSIPPEILDYILSFISYKDIANTRLVSRDMNRACSARLNKTFNKLQNDVLIRFQRIKSQMPRRESLRRTHPLAGESDVIETVHMRLILLQMTFGRHIERKHCCFFPGEILDEIYRILAHIKETPRLLSAYRVTDELFDLTSMAMEYFKEKIEPHLPGTSYFRSDYLFDCSAADHITLESSRFEVCGSQASTSSSMIEWDNGAKIDSPPQSNMVLRKRIRKIKLGMRKYNTRLASMQKEMKSYKGKISEQQKIILDYSQRLDKCAKKNDELTRKFGTLLQELNKCKTELQYWRSNRGNPLSPELNEGIDATGLQVQAILPANEEVKNDNEPTNIEDTKDSGNNPSSSSSSGDLKETGFPAEAENTQSAFVELSKELEQINYSVDNNNGEISNVDSVGVSTRSTGPFKRRHASPENKSDVKKLRDSINLRSKTIKTQV